MNDAFQQPPSIKELTIKFKPYTPPNEGGGPLTVDKDLCWRLNPEGLVTPAVIGAVCWARNHFKILGAQHRGLLVGLGLEYHEGRTGGTVLRPRDAYRVPLDVSKGCDTAQRDNPAVNTFTLTTPVLPLAAYDAIEVYSCIEGEDGIERFEANEHTPATVPHFWSVALHLQSGGIETIADFPAEAQADTFGELMRGVVLAARQAAGLDACYLLAGNTNRA